MVTAAETRIEEALTRQAFREFLRTHHPDLGGDPIAFQAGLELFGRGARRASRPPNARLVVTVHHRRRGLGVFLDWFELRRERRRRPSRVH